ncbi:LacI family DNA-binding transcriptional regulator [Pelagovum pacificum]|uniref:LacI family DNA-binding transcriptional regulator n=1 Tax=Pelagovum pacificum TaxID=2588711 RepID=UPI001E44E697|nr:LacI family DNA-binding transcriptional regulator [Pelagovum pacificum]
MTIRSVAEDAGVSVAAVSKVLRNAYGVSDHLRAKVQTSIEKLGYRPSTAARGMRGRTYTVGVLLVEMVNPFLSQIVMGLKPALEDANYQFLMGVGGAEMKIEGSLIDSMTDMRMDGLVLVAPRLHGELLAQYARNIPTVVIGHHEPSATAFDTVNSDDREGARLVVRSLVAAGHRDIHMASLPPRSGSFEVYTERELGFREAMAEAGLGDRAKVWHFREVDGQPAPPLEAFFDIDPAPTAVFVWSDKHAIQLLDAARARGIVVPRDLAVIGYDNTPIANLSMIGLSSVEQRAGEIGRMAAQSLMSRIEGRTTPEHILIQPELSRRASS